MTTPTYQSSSVFSVLDVLLVRLIEIVRAGIFRSWSSAIGSGYVWFSGWAFQTPGLNIKQVIAILLCLSANVSFLDSHALSAIRFVQHNHYINLSRISPLDLHTVHTALDGTRSVLHANRRIAVCLSPMLVVESQLSSPTDRGLRNKFIKGTLHHQEMQRFVGVTCMVFNQPVLHAQIERDSMIFSTMGSWHASGQWLIFCLTYSLALTTVCLRFKATVLFRSELSSYSWNHWENFKGCKNQGLLTCHQGRP